MGGIITSNIILREYNLNSSSKELYPSYFSSILYSNDLSLCLKQWELIITNNLPLYHSCTIKKKYFDCCLTWFKSILYYELLNNMKISVTLFSFINKLIDLNLTMILINLKQRCEFKLLDSQISDIATQLIRLGFQHHHFIEFGYSLFRSLPIVLGDDFTLQCHQSWKNLYSSILAVCIPLCLSSSSTIGEDMCVMPERSNDTNTNLRDTVDNLSEVVLPSSQIRMFATLHNSISL